MNWYALSPKQPTWQELGWIDKTWGSKQQRPERLVSNHFFPVVKYILQGWRFESVGGNPRSRLLRLFSLPRFPQLQGSQQVLFSFDFTRGYVFCNRLPRSHWGAVTVGIHCNPFSVKAWGGLLTFESSKMASWNNSVFQLSQQPAIWVILQHPKTRPQFWMVYNGLYIYIYYMYCIVLYYITWHYIISYYIIL